MVGCAVGDSFTVLACANSTVTELLHTTRSLEGEDWLLGIQTILNCTDMPKNRVVLTMKCAFARGHTCSSPANVAADHHAVRNEARPQPQSQLTKPLVQRCHVNVNVASFPGFPGSVAAE